MIPAGKRNRYTSNQLKNRHHRCRLQLARESQRGNDPLEIGISIIFDLNPTAFVAVAKRDVRAQMLLQPILQIFNDR